MAAAPGGDAVDRLVGLGSAGLDLDVACRELLGRLRRVMTVDAAFVATVDPATLLFTSAAAEVPLRDAGTAFLTNELDGGDVNHFGVLAQTPGHVRSLDQATQGDRGASARYRDVMAPLGLGDELRAALIIDGQCWGALCLHREDAAAGFSGREVALLRRLVPHLGRALRHAQLAGRPSPSSALPGPGVLLVGRDGVVLSVTEEARRWLELLDPEAARHGGLPLPVRTLVSRHQRGPGASPAGEVTLRTRDGGWVTVTSSALSGAHAPQLAVVLTPAAARRVSSLLLAGYALPPAQRRVAELVLRGRSTRQIVEELYLSEYTVQEYLRAVFDKVGVNSRRELVAALLPR